MQQPQHVKTKDVLTKRGITKLFGFTPAPKTDCIGVCDGEWRKEKDGWRFFRLADL